MNAPSIPALVGPWRAVASTGMAHPPFEVDAWLPRHTFGPGVMTPDQAARAKAARGISISVALPALNEQETVGEICASIASELMGDRGVVDQLLVIDSGSEDATAERAAAAGAEVYDAGALTAVGPPVLGKGDCLWRSLTVIRGSLVVWIDSDIENFSPTFVVDLVAPLLADPDLAFTKAFYERPLKDDEGLSRTGGARVTELVARPLLQLFYPELGALIQPLAGEYAGYTRLFRSIPFFTGYGVEVGMLIDLLEKVGIDRIAQVDLGVRVHRNRTLLELGAMSYQVMTAILRRLDDAGKVKLGDDLPDTLIQFVPLGAGLPSSRTSRLKLVERPPFHIPD